MSEVIPLGLPHERIREERGDQFYYCRPAPGWAALYHYDVEGYRVVIFPCHLNAKPWQLADRGIDDRDIVYERLDSIVQVLGVIRHHQELLTK